MHQPLRQLIPLLYSFDLKLAERHSIRKHSIELLLAVTHPQPRPQPCSVQNIVTISRWQTEEKRTLEINLAEIVEVNLFATVKLPGILLQLCLAHNPWIVWRPHILNAHIQVRQMILVLSLESLPTCPLPLLRRLPNLVHIYQFTFIRQLLLDRTSFPHLFLPPLFDLRRPFHLQRQKPSRRPDRILPAPFSPPRPPSDCLPLQHWRATIKHKHWLHAVEEQLADSPEEADNMAVT